MTTGACNFTNSGSNTFLSKGSPVATAAPITMFCWFNVPAAPVIQHTLIGLERMPPGFGGFEYFRLALTASGSNPGYVAAELAGPGLASAAAVSASQYTTGAWHTAFAEFTSQSSRTAYLDGVAGTAETSNIAPSGLEDTLIGVGATSTVGSYYGPLNGCIAHAAIWDIALSSSEKAALAAGTTTPDLVQPAHLLLYVPFVDEASRAEQFAWDGAAVSQGSDMTVNLGAGSITTCGSAPTISGPPEPAVGSPNSIADSIQRAWTFTLDNHTFYMFDIGQEGTFGVDVTTGYQWWRAKTAGFDNQWNVQNGVMWGNRIVGGSLDSFEVWEVKAEALTDGDRDVSFTFVAGDVNATTNVITHASHGMYSGDGPFEVSNSGGALPGGLSASTSYWVIRASSSTFKLATSRADAFAGNAVDITSTGSGTQTLASTVYQITHVSTGGLQTRSRVKLPVSALRISAPPGDLGDEDGSAMVLRFSDNNGETWSSQRSVTLTPDNFNGEIAFRALGSFAAPGRVFELTDVGGPVRLDGVDAEGPGFGDDAAR